MNNENFFENIDRLPAFLKSILSLFRDYESCVQNAVLHSFLAGFGSAVDRVYFMHEGRKQNCHYYVGIYGASGSGKSCSTTIKTLFQKEHQRLRNLSSALRSEYTKTLKESKKEDRELIQIPPLFTFFLPGDTTTSALVSTVLDNKGRGCIWESELDTVTRMMKSEFGNFSDALRNNYDGSMITYNRRTGKEIIEVENSHFSAVFSGTPGQYVRFFGTSENGLFSRFTFCKIDTEDVWKDRWDSAANTNILTDYSYQVAEIIQRLAKEDTEVVFDKNCRRLHFEYFSQAYRDFQDLGGESMRGLIKRTGVNCIKWASLFEILSHVMDESYGGIRYKCRFEYMQVALQLAEYVLQDAVEILAKLPREERLRSNEWEEYFRQLPQEFSYLDMPQNKGKSSIYRHLSDWINKNRIIKQGEKYKKILIS